MQKRATILDKNKKIRCDLRPTTAPNVDGTGIGFTFTSFYPNPTLSLAFSLSLILTHFAHWLCYMTMKICIAFVWLPLAALTICRLTVWKMMKGRWLSN